MQFLFSINVLYKFTCGIIKILSCLRKKPLLFNKAAFILLDQKNSKNFKINYYKFK